MYLSPTLLSLSLLAASAVSTPVDLGSNDVEASLVRVVCTPNPNQCTRQPPQVDVKNAQDEAQVGGGTKGKSGYPHEFVNIEGLVFGVHNCDNKQNTLMEYPVFWVEQKQRKWKKEVKKDKQDATPLRVIYARVGGGYDYCGVVTHQRADSKCSGAGDFVLCH